MTLPKRTLVLALATLLGLTTACTTNHPTLLAYWPAATDADAEPNYGVGIPRKSVAAARWFEAQAELGVPEA